MAFGVLGKERGRLGGKGEIWVEIEFARFNPVLVRRVPVRAAPVANTYLASHLYKG